MSIKKGTQFTDSTGSTYTATGFLIKQQMVNYTRQTGSEIMPGQMSASEWKELAASVNQLEAADIVNKAPEPGNGTDTAIAEPVVATNLKLGNSNAQKLIIIKGMRFQMMDKSTWRISEYNRNTKQLVAVNEKTQKSQDFTLEELQNLANDGYIKILS